MIKQDLIKQYKQDQKFKFMAEREPTDLDLLLYWLLKDKLNYSTKSV